MSPNLPSKLHEASTEDLFRLAGVCFDYRAAKDFDRVYAELERRGEPGAITRLREVLNGGRPGDAAPASPPAWIQTAEAAARKVQRGTTETAGGARFFVYVCLLWDVEGTEQFSLYVGSSANPPEQRHHHHLSGKKSSAYVEHFGLKGERGLAKSLFAHLNPLASREAAEAIEFELACALRAGFRELGEKRPQVFGGAQEQYHGRDLPSFGTAEELRACLNGRGNLPASMLRGGFLTIPRQTDPGARGELKLHDYQEDTVKTILAAPADNGVVMLPTGAGKTRLAIELIRRTLAADPGHLVLWVSYPTLLIEQALGALIDHADAFDRPLRACFMKEKQGAEAEDLFKSLQLVLLLRDTWTEALKSCGEQRGPLFRALCAGRRVTVVLDEVHVLLSESVARAWRAAQRHFPPNLAPRCVGLSATPEPSRAGGKRFLAQLMPATARRGEGGGYRRFVEMSVDALRRRGVLAGIDRRVQDRGWFNVPPELVRRAREGDPVELPARTEKGNVSDAELDNFVRQFNRAVMGSEGVLDFLADRLAAHLPSLGKTLVFVPSIPAANGLVQRLAARSTRPEYDYLEGALFIAHSELGSLGPYAFMQDSHRPRAQVAAYQKRGSAASIMVTVDLLTTGFDDPKIQTVVLARLTTAKNLFWQMIGRGTRGLAAGGTADCTVIDPIRLQEYFQYEKGYFHGKLDLLDQDPDTVEGHLAGIKMSVPPQVDGAVSPIPPRFVLAAFDEDAQAVHALLKRGLAAAGDRSEVQRWVLAYGLRVDDTGRTVTRVDPDEGEPRAWASILAMVVEQRAQETGRFALLGLLEALRGRERSPELVDAFLAAVHRVEAGGEVEPELEALRGVGPKPTTAVAVAAVQSVAPAAAVAPGAPVAAVARGSKAKGELAGLVLRTQRVDRTARGEWAKLWFEGPARALAAAPSWLAAHGVFVTADSKGALYCERKLVGHRSMWDRRAFLEAFEAAGGQVQAELRVALWGKGSGKGR